MTHTFLAAVSLVFVIEGILPFLLPRFWRHMMSQMVVQPDKIVRIFGLVSMLLGLAFLYLLFK